MNVDPHVYLPAELVKHGHEAIDREAVKLHIADAGKVRMADTGSCLGLPRRQAFVIENTDDPGGQQRLGLLHVGVSAAKVTEDIAATMHQLEIVLGFAHCCPLPLGRARRLPLPLQVFIQVLFNRAKQMQPLLLTVDGVRLAWI